MTVLQGIDAVILAGGLGTRLRAAVADRPKVLAEVEGRPFLALLLDQLHQAGVRRTVLCTGYLGEQVAAAFGARYRDMDLLYSREDAPLGTGGALRLSLPLLSSDPVLAMNGDSFCDADFAALRQGHATACACASLALAGVADIGRFGAVQTDDSHAVVGFDEKGAGSGAGRINAGIYLLTRAVIEAIPPGQPVSLEREIFPRLIGKGLYGFAQKGRFIDIGVPAEYHRASAYLAQSQENVTRRRP